MKKVLKTLLVAGAISLTACAPNTIHAVKDPANSEVMYYEQWVVQHNIKDVYQRILSVIDSRNVSWLKGRIPQNFYGDEATITWDSGSVISFHFEMKALDDQTTVVDTWTYLGKPGQKCGGPVFGLNLGCFKEAVQ